MDTSKQQYLITTMRDVLAKHFGIENPSLKPDDSLESLGLDSMGFVEYVFELESSLDVTFPDVPREITTVGDFVRFVDAHTPATLGARANSG